MDSLAAAIAAVPLTTYTFSDNTGTVGVAPGWTTQAPTISGATLNGPADQHVFIDVSGSVIPPDSQMIKMNQQLAMNVR